MAGQPFIHCPGCRLQIPIQSAAQAVSQPIMAPVEYPIQDHSVQPVPRPSLVPAPVQRRSVFRLSEYETSWRSKFPHKFSLYLGIVQFVFIVLIVILEIAALAVAPSWRPTGVGIWSAIVFSIAAAMKIKLGRSSTRF